MNVLERIVSSTRAELETRKAQTSPQALREAAMAAMAAAAAARSDRPRFIEALRAPGLSLIAEHKRRSPSAGAIREGSSLDEIVGAYERAGAAALSILTESPNFGGSLEDLRAARAVSRLPLLRKDFIVDPYQVDEAVLAGADAILLIVAALDDATLHELHELASSRGLDALVEVHDQAELQRAIALGAPIIGVNNRDLTTLAVDTDRALELRAAMPDGTVAVAESGYSRPEQLVELSAAGVDAVLIGEALMRSPDLESATRALTAAA